MYWNSFKVNNVFKRLNCRDKDCEHCGKFNAFFIHYSFLSGDLKQQGARTMWTLIWNVLPTQPYLPPAWAQDPCLSVKNDWGSRNPSLGSICSLTGRP